MNKEAVAAIIYDEKSKEVLIGRKRDDQEGFLKGQYHVPGETLEVGESDEQALKRGMMEEAGIEVKILRYLGSHVTPTHTKVRWYECEPLNRNICFGSDLAEVSWVPIKKVISLCSPKAVRLWPKKVKEYFSK